LLKSGRDGGWLKGRLLLLRAILLALLLLMGIMGGLLLLTLHPGHYEVGRHDAGCACPILRNNAVQRLRRAVGVKITRAETRQPGFGTLLPVK
jgi:hypothetical protein